MQYSSKFFTTNERDWKSLGTFKKSEAGILPKLYDKIANHANKNNLEVVKVSELQDGHLGHTGIAVLFKSN